MTCNDCPYQNPIACCHNVLKLGSPLQAWLLALLIKFRGAVILANRKETLLPRQYHPAIPELLHSYWNAHYQLPSAGLYGGLIDFNRRLADV